MKTGRKTLLLSCAISALFLSSCASTKHAVQENDKSIVLLYDNDVHCAIDGYAQMAGLRDAVRDTAYVALLSSGDFLQGGTAGALSHGKYIADIMQHMGYDALTLGNHEFDYNVPTMMELLKQIGAPVACVNLRDMSKKRIYEPFVIKQMGTKKVAFVGAVTPTTLYTEAYSFYDKDENQLYDLAEKEIYQLVQEQVIAARKKGADYVILLAHLGEDKNAINVDSHGLVASTNGIDAVLDGHTHSYIEQDLVKNKDGKLIPISQTGTKLRNVGKLIITPKGKISTQLIPIQQIKEKNAKVQQATDSIKTLMDKLVKRTICQSDVDLRILDEKGKQAVRRGETNAGDIVTDAYRIMTGADFAITNGGGIRTQAKAGTLTYGDIVALLPYDNYVSIVEITGEQLVEVLTACTSFLPVENGDFPQVSGMKFTIDTAKKDDRITNLMILNKENGAYEPVKMDHTYQLATIDYCITGGGLQGKLKKNNVIKPNIMIYNECLIQYITEKLNGHITNEYAEPQGRITIK